MTYCGLTSFYMPMFGGLYNPLGFYSPMMPATPQYSVNDYNIFGFTPPTNFGYMPWLDTGNKPYNVYPQPLLFGTGNYTPPERNYSNGNTFNFLQNNNNTSNYGGIFGFLSGKSSTTNSQASTGYPTKPYSTSTYNTGTFGFLTNRTQSTYTQRSSNPTVNKAVELAKSQVGVYETTKNDSVDIRKYKNGSVDTNPWCTSFISWCYGAGQGDDNEKTFGYDRSSQSIKQKAERAGCYSTKSSGYTPKVGDLMVLKNSDKGGGHVGIIVAVNNDGTFETVEGNIDNQVKKVHRSMDTKNLHGFVRMDEWLKA